MSHDTRCEQHWIDALPSALSDRLAEFSVHTFERFIETPSENKSQTSLFWAACELIRAAFTPEEQQIILRGWFSGYYRLVEDREITRAISNAMRKLTNEVACADSYGPRWPDADPDLIREIVTSPDGALDELRRSSPMPESQLLTSGQMIDRLFRPNDLVCFGTRRKHASTGARESFRGRESLFPFIVPNAMAARTGIKTDGGISARCLANVGPVIFQVIEFDKATIDEQARTLLHLRTMMPLRTVIFSGSKSLHGWFDVRSIAAAKLEDFRRYAAALGADRAMFTPCQFARMPNAMRDNGNQQSVLFLT